MDRLHVEGMSEDEGETFAPIQVSYPIPREDTFDRHDKRITIRRNDLRSSGISAATLTMSPPKASAAASAIFVALLTLVFRYA
jgi:hypothetical protein